MLTERFARFKVFLHSLRNGCRIFAVSRPVMYPNWGLKFALRLREAVFSDAVGSERCASVSQLVEQILGVGAGLITGFDYIDWGLL